MKWKTLMTCFEFLGPYKHNYWRSTCEAGIKSNKGRRRILRPLDEFFLVLVRLHLGLFEQDIAYRFDISQSTVSRIIMTWINLLYHQLKQIPLWPPRALTLSNIPKIFREKYPSTRVIIDEQKFLSNNLLYPSYSN